MLFNHKDMYIWGYMSRYKTGCVKLSTYFDRDGYQLALASVACLRALEQQMRRHAHEVARAFPKDQKAIAVDYSRARGI